MLGSHPAVGTYTELLDRRGQRYPESLRSDILFFAAYARRRAVRRNPLARAHLFSYLDELYSPKSDLEAVGFKLMYSQARENPAVLAYLRLRRVSVVHLVRANLLDVIVSDETARARGRYHSPSVDLDPVTVSLDPGAVVKRLAVLDRQVRIVRRVLAATRIPTIEVSYEDLAADSREFDKILRFLAVRDSSYELTSKLRKLNTLKKPQIVENYREIEGTLSGTRFARFLD